MGKKKTQQKLDSVPSRECMAGVAAFFHPQMFIPDPLPTIFTETISPPTSSHTEPNPHIRSSNQVSPSVTPSSISTPTSFSVTLSATSTPGSTSTPIDEPVPSTSNQTAPVPAGDASTDENNNTGVCCSGLHCGNVCVHIKAVLDSATFTFIVGTLCLVGGIILVILSTVGFIPQGDYFLIGPFALAAGAIIIVRGIIHVLAEKQRQVEEAQQAEDAERTRLTREERMALAEAQALAQDNQSIPPSYSEAASKPNLRLSISAHSQATIPFMSAQSQTHMPDTRSVGVDTSDLMSVSASVALMAPPSYDQALHPGVFYLGSQENNTQ